MDCVKLWLCWMTVLFAVTVTALTESDISVTVAAVGSTVTLSCRGFTDSCIRWEHYPVGSNQPVDVYNGIKVSPAYNHSHSVAFDTRSPGVSNLTVNSVQMNNSGKYKCFQSPSTSNSNLFELVVLESEPRCSCPKCFDDVMEMDTLHVNCDVVHSHTDKLAAVFSCETSLEFGYPVNATYRHDKKCTHANNPVAGSVCRQDCTVDIPANRNIQDRQLQCNMRFSNSSGYVHGVMKTRNSWDSNATFNVLYGPSSVSVNASNGTSLNYDSVLSCTADSHPPSTYTWSDVTTGRTLHNGSTLTVDKLYSGSKLVNALIQCTATTAHKTANVVVAVGRNMENNSKGAEANGGKQSSRNLTVLLVCCVVALCVFIVAVVCVVWRLRTNGGCHGAKHPDVVPTHAPAQPTESLELGVLTPAPGTDPTGQTQLTVLSEVQQTTVVNADAEMPRQGPGPQTLIRQHQYMECLPPEEYGVSHETALVDPTTGSLLYADLAISPRHDVTRRATSTPNIARTDPLYALIDHRIKSPTRRHHRGTAGKVSSHRTRQPTVVDNVVA